MLYVANGNVYIKDNDGNVHPVDVTAKNKVIMTSELESITPQVHDETVDLPKDAVGATMDDVVRKFNLSEKRPIKFDERKHVEAVGVSSGDRDSANAGAGDSAPAASRKRKPGRPKVKKAE